jgi:hypothetical protein
MKKSETNSKESDFFLGKKKLIIFFYKICNKWGQNARCSGFGGLKDFFSTPTFNSLPLQILKYSNFALILLYYFLSFLFFDFFDECCTPLQTHCSDKLLNFFDLLNLPVHFSKVFRCVK